MIQDTSELLYKYKEYKVPYQKIKSLIEKEELLPVKRGLYETDPEIPGYVLANDILGPSYLSFEWALSYYGMIPERVHTYTSASFDLKKNKKFENVFGIYTYQDVPKQVFPFYYTREIVNNRSFNIASREKALCDLLSTLKPIRGLKDFEDYLFDGMRLDEDIFEELEFDKIRRIAPMYHKTNLNQLIRFIDKEGD